MKEQKHTLFSSALYGIGFAAIMFVLTGVIFDCINGGTTALYHYGFTKMALGTLVVGLGFGLPSLVYEREQLSLPVQIMIHMGIGCIVLLLTSWVVGWIPREQGLLGIAKIAAEQLLIAFGIWFGFYLNQKKLAQKMNQKLSELEHKTK